VSAAPHQQPARHMFAQWLTCFLHDTPTERLAAGEACAAPAALGWRRPSMAVAASGKICARRGRQPTPLRARRPGRRLRSRAKLLSQTGEALRNKSCTAGRGAAPGRCLRCCVSTLWRMGACGDGFCVLGSRTGHVSYQRAFISNTYTGQHSDSSPAAAHQAPPRPRSPPQPLPPRPPRRRPA